MGVLYTFNDIRFQISKKVVVELAAARVVDETAKLEKAQERINVNLVVVSTLLSELGIEMDPRSFVKLRKTLGNSTAAVTPFIHEGELPGTVVEYNMLPASMIAEKGTKLDDACNKVDEADAEYKTRVESIENWDRFRRAAEIQEGSFDLSWDQLNVLKY
jgi:hypothetical protein